MKLRLSVLTPDLAVCRLGSAAALPAWIAGPFTSITRTGEELSIVCDAAAVPHDVKAERGWRALEIEGPIPFEMTGVAASVVGPLAAAGISVFPIATFDTDYILVRSRDLERAAGVLRDAGHTVTS